MLSTRLRLALIVLTLIGLAAAVAAVLLASRSKRSDQRGPAAVLHERSRFQGAQRPRIPTRDFWLTDQDGRRVSLKGQRGKVVVLTFLYSTCKETCPLQAQIIRGALDDLGAMAKRVSVLAISTNPTADTPQHVKSFLVKQHVLGRIHYLTGPRAKLKPIWKQFAIQPQTDKLEHSAYTILLDKKGRQAVGHPYSQTNSEMIAHDIRLLIREGDRGRSSG